MPTDEQLREYAEKLPQIYRDVLATFPAINPERKAGYGLTVETVLDHLIDSDRGYDTADVQDALAKLEERGFLTLHRKMAWYAPTQLGERLVTVLTGHTPRSSGAPPLPVPTWG